MLQEDEKRVSLVEGPERALVGRPLSIHGDMEAVLAKLRSANRSGLDPENSAEFSGCRPEVRKVAGVPPGFKDVAESIGKECELGILCQSEAELVHSGRIRNPLDAKTRSNVAFASVWCRSELESGFKMKIPIKIEDFNRLAWVRRFLEKLSRLWSGFCRMTFSIAMRTLERTPLDDRTYHLLDRDGGWID
jgi:hypothetical protein